MIKFPTFLSLSFALVALATIPSVAQDKMVTDKIFFGGDILTMAGPKPEYADAVVVKNGKIVFAGPKAEAVALNSEPIEMVDLNGQTMMPGFIDSHSHFAQTAIKLSTVNLDPPPAGTISKIADLQEALRTELANNPRGNDEWLFGWGYDNGFLAEKRHPTREDLDAVSTDVPIALYHFSSHVVAANSRALELVGINAETKAPVGGVIQRQAGSKEPNGVLEETAIAPILEILLSSASGDRLAELFDLAQQEYIEAGFTTMLEMGGEPNSIAAMRQFAKDGRLKVDLITAPLIIILGKDTIAKAYSTEYENHFRIGGGKINLDGGSPGRTAYLREPYYKQAEGASDDYRGYPSMKQKDMNAIVEGFYEAKVPVFVHALGDAAVDQAIVAIEGASKKFPQDDPRTQLIHLQMFHPDQMDALKDLGVTLTFQIAHNFYFGDFHNDVIYGPERTKKLNPMKSAVDRGYSVTMHHDSPVHPVSQLDLISFATNRSSRSGAVYGPEERISAYEALRGSTIEAAYQLREENRKGSIEVGKLADFVILDRNPLKVPSDEIQSISITGTIKEGALLYKK